MTAIIGHDERFVELVDTGGYSSVDSDALSEHIVDQVHKGMTTADLVIFVVDIRDGLTPLDAKIAEIKQQCNIP